MPSLEVMLSRFNGHPGASSSWIAEYQKLLKVELPKDYREFLSVSNGGEGFIGSYSYAIFWSVEELGSMNAAYEVDRYVPNCLLFGSNGGGEAYGFDYRQTEIKIVKLPFIVMEWDAAILQSSSFPALLDGLFNA